MPLKIQHDTNIIVSIQQQQEAEKGVDGKFFGGRKQAFFSMVYLKRVFSYMNPGEIYNDIFVHHVTLDKPGFSHTH